MAHKKQPMSVPVTYPISLLDKEATVEMAIQENLLCLQSLKDGFFNEKDRVRRLSLCQGDGQFLQCGGNKIGDSAQPFGLSLGKLI